MKAYVFKQARGGRVQTEESVPLSIIDEYYYKKSYDNDCISSLQLKSICVDPEHLEVNIDYYQNPRGLRFGVHRGKKSLVHTFLNKPEPFMYYGI